MSVVGREIHFQPRRKRALLGFVACGPGLLKTSPDLALHTLRSTLSHVRRAPSLDLKFTLLRPCFSVTGMGPKPGVRG